MGLCTTITTNGNFSIKHIVSIKCTPKEFLQNLNAVLSDGRVRVYQLKEPTYSEADLAIGLESHHTLSMHDCQTGAINKLQLSVDGKFLVSCGLDGNIFSYEVVPPEEVKLREFKEEPIDQVIFFTEILRFISKFKILSSWQK